MEIQVMFVVTVSVNRCRCKILFSLTQKLSDKISSQKKSSEDMMERA